MTSSKNAALLAQWADLWGGNVSVARCAWAGRMKVAPVSAWS